MQATITRIRDDGMPEVTIRRSGAVYGLDRAPADSAVGQVLEVIQPLNSPFVVMVPEDGARGRV